MCDGCLHFVGTERRCVSCARRHLAARRRRASSVALAGFVLGLALAFSTGLVLGAARSEPPAAAVALSALVP